MRVLITGVTGFVGGHLAEFLLKKKNIKIYGVSRNSPKDPILREILKKTSHYPMDLNHKAELKKILSRVRPDRIFHLAAQSSVPWSWKHPRETYTQNTGATLSLLESLRELRLFPRVQIAGSAQEYGIPDKQTGCIPETAAMHPLNPYALTKVIQDDMVLQYYKNYGIPVIRTRAFNQIGPRQSQAFMTAEFARQVALIEAGRMQAVMQVGDLSSVRDFTDVRDTVSAYWQCLERGRAGQVYNIASGKGRSAGDILDIYLSLSTAKIVVKKDPRRFRKNELPYLVGDASRLRRETGWKPKILLERSLSGILNEWRKRIHEK